jgi:ubiquinone biosynthesis accessory factor UbiJ
MLQTVRELLLPAAQARVVLLINHVLSREPVALQRLQPHAGRRLRVEVVDAPGWLPTPPPMTVAVTPAGLFELDTPAMGAEPDLSLRVSMPTPAQWLDMAGGQTTPPSVRIDGAADLAAEMHWLVDHLRWDIEGDLAQAIGPLPARVVMSVGRAGAGALRRLFAGAAPQPDGTAR